MKINQHQYKLIINIEKELDILKFKAVLLIDSLFSLYIFTTIVFTLIPLLISLNHTLKENQIIEIKQTIMSSINHYDKNPFKRYKFR